MQEEKGKTPHCLFPASSICLTQPPAVFAWPSWVAETSCRAYYLLQALGLLFVMFSLFILISFHGSPKNFELIQNNFNLFLFFGIILSLTRTEDGFYGELISDTAPLFFKLSSFSLLNSLAWKIFHSFPFPHQTPILDCTLFLLCLCIVLWFGFCTVFYWNSLLLKCNCEIPFCKGFYHLFEKDTIEMQRAKQNRWPRSKGKAPVKIGEYNTIFSFIHVSLRRTQRLWIFCQHI